MYHMSGHLVARLLGSQHTFIISGHLTIAHCCLGAVPVSDASLVACLKGSQYTLFLRVPLIIIWCHLEASSRLRLWIIASFAACLSKSKHTISIKSVYYSTSATQDQVPSCDYREIPSLAALLPESQQTLFTNGLLNINLCCLSA